MEITRNRTISHLFLFTRRHKEDLTHALGHHVYMVLDDQECNTISSPYDDNTNATSIGVRFLHVYLRFRVLSDLLIFTGALSALSTLIWQRCSVTPKTPHCPALVNFLHVLSALSGNSLARKIQLQLVVFAENATSALHQVT
jgi:hypothetical protein